MLILHVATLRKLMVCKVFTDDIWLEQSIHLVRRICHFTDDEVVQLHLNAADSSWASDAVKLDLRRQIEEFHTNFGV